MVYFFDSLVFIIQIKESIVSAVPVEKLCDNRHIIIEPDFIERNFGEAEGLTKKERETSFPDGYDCGMESIENLCKRAKIAILKQVDINIDKTLLIVAHGSILKAILTSISSGKVAYSPGKELIEVGKLCLLEYKNNVFEILVSNFNHANCSL